MFPSLLLARSGYSNLHALLRIIPRSHAAEPCSVPDPESLSNFLMAKTPLQLIQSIDKLGIMKSTTKPLELEELTGQIGKKKGLMGSSIVGLFSECFFDPYSGFWSIPNGIQEDFDPISSRAGAKQAVDKYDVIKNDLPSQLADMQKNDDVVAVVEPLQDWLLIRNILSISARIVVSMRKNANGALESAGFRFVSPKPFEKWFGDVGGLGGFITPFALNPFFRPGSLFFKIVNDSMSEICPLYTELFGDEMVGNIFARHYIGALRDSADIKALTSVQADVVRPSISKSLSTQQNGRSGNPDWDIEVPVRQYSPETDMRHWMYLTVLGEEDDQFELASKVIDSFHRLIYKPSAIVRQTRAEDLSTIHRTFSSAAWQTLLSHSGHYLMTCQQCHRTIFALNKNPDRRFCSDSCRASWNKALREAQMQTQLLDIAAIPERVTSPQ